MGSRRLTAADSGPLALYVWKTTADPFVGKLTYFRIYSGSLQGDTRIWNQNKSAEERMAGLSIIRGKETMPVKVVHSGDIAIVAKLTATTTGDTLCDKGHPLTLPMPSLPACPFPGCHQAQDPGGCGQDFAHAYPPVRRRYDPFLAPGTGHRSDHPAGHG